MPEDFPDQVDRVLRDHQGYTGDGQGGNGALPVGDRGTARKPISNRDLRELFKAPAGYANQAAADSAAAKLAAAQALLYGRPPLYDNLSAVIIDTLLTYSPDDPGTVLPGQSIMTAQEGFALRVLTYDAPAYDKITAPNGYQGETAGGVKWRLSAGNRAWIEIGSASQGGSPTSAAPDCLLIHHTQVLGEPGNGVHVLGYSPEGHIGGQAGGFAMDGPGTSNAITGNRQGAGGGQGVEGNRLGSGDGHGVHGIKSSTGAGHAGRFFKQNDDGTSIGTAGVGDAVSAINYSSQGRGLHAETAQWNPDFISHELSRGNWSGGIVTEIRFSGGLIDERISSATAIRIPVAPGTPWAGNHPVYGLEVFANANVTGANQVALVSAVSDAAGNTFNIGVVGAARGTNAHNIGGDFSASGGSGNTALRAQGEVRLQGTIWAPNLPTYANNAAAAAELAAGWLYITPTGEIRGVV